MHNNKRGQGLSTNAIILIVLGVIVLVLLIIGFTAGFDKLAPWLKPSNNVAEISQACSIACSTNSQYNYCALSNTIKDGTNPEFPDTCNNLANDPKYTARNYGIQKCPSITCAATTTEESGTGTGGTAPAN